MYSVQKLLQMINSEKSSTRYDACEWLRIHQESSPEIVYALQKTTHDPDAEVAHRATLALQSDVHHQMMIKMGLIKAEEEKPSIDDDSYQVAGQVEPIAVALDDHARMLKEIRSWGYWLIGLGVLHFVSNGFLNAPWGVMLILVGLASFYFQTASMFIIYAMTLAWAGVYNLLGYSGARIIFSLFQIIIAIRIFMSYRRYRKVEIDHLTALSDRTGVSSHEGRAPKAFPWIGSSLGCISILGLVSTIFVVIFIAATTQSTSSVPRYLNFIYSLFVNLGILGFAVGLASLLSKFRLKALAITGMVAGALTLILDLVSQFL